MRHNQNTAKIIPFSIVNFSMGILYKGDGQATHPKEKKPNKGGKVNAVRYLKPR